MVAILSLLIGALRNCIMSRGRLEAEVIVLRHQLNILRRQSPRRFGHVLDIDLDPLKPKDFQIQRSKLS